MRKTRFFFVLASFLLLPSAFCLQPSRIEILQMRERFASNTEAEIAGAVSARLCRELKQRGFDAESIPRTYEDLDRHAEGNADWYVEILSSDARRHPVGGLGLGGRHVGVDVSLVVSQVAAELRLYDGKTLDQVDTFDLEKRSTDILPTAVGVARHHIFASLVIPLFQFGRYRAAAGAVAREAASLIEQAIRPAAEAAPN